MKIEHTPGPWQVEREYVFAVQTNGQEITIAVISGVEHAGHVSEANANLISAAPDMLSFIETVAQGHLTHQGMVDSAKRFIERLEGGAE